MDTTIHQETDNESRYLAEIRKQLDGALGYFETHRKLGDTEGAWFHYGIALGLHQALVALGDSDDSDFHGPDPIALSMEAPKDERVTYLHLIQEALGDMDFGDYVPDETHRELQLYRGSWDKRVMEEGR